MNILIQNKKIFHFYSIKKKYIAGAILTGSEVKSIRLKHISISNSFVSIEDNIVFLNKCIINPTFFINKEFIQVRKIKLLLNKKEIIFLNFCIKKKGYTIVIENVLLLHGWIKFTLCVAIGKKKYDKRIFLQEKELRNKIIHY